MKRGSQIKFWFVNIMMMVLIFACEEPYTPSTLESEQEIVVEGYIEAGDRSQSYLCHRYQKYPFFE
ncbi:MAG: hypothetical protein IPN49_09155 [Saprospiraceae bacterium]|nr:hypothetical protein [Saprospiraceae bacterium]